eukprot:4074234-Prymnesium_polylepis.1
MKKRDHKWSFSPPTSEGGSGGAEAATPSEKTVGQRRKRPKAQGLYIVLDALLHYVGLRRLRKQMELEFRYPPTALLTGDKKPRGHVADPESCRRACAAKP